MSMSRDQFIKEIYHPYLGGFGCITPINGPWFKKESEFFLCPGSPKKIPATGRLPHPDDRDGGQAMQNEDTQNPDRIWIREWMSGQ
jgi:hypothetical protein